MRPDVLTTTSDSIEGHEELPPGTFLDDLAVEDRILL